MSSLLRASICAALCGAAAYAPAAHASDGWDWAIAPYLWGATISTDTGLDSAPPGGNVGDLEFDNALNDLDGAFEVHLEGHGDHFGMLADFTYLGLASDKSFDRFDTASDLDARLLDLAGTWSPDSDRAAGFDLIAGLRYIDLDYSLEFDPVNPAFANSSFKASETFTDFLLGGRYVIPMSERWSLALRADGSWGDTDGTWSVNATAAYKTEHGAWAFGWRHMEAKFKPNDNNVDITLSGPIIGYAFRF